MSEKVLAQLRKPADKRSFGGHGRFEEFMLLVAAAPDDADLSAVELPLRIRCSTCKFLTPEFHEKMPCWECVEDETLPKWRPKK